jgi:hypothetical protein
MKQINNNFTISAGGDTFAELDTTASNEPVADCTSATGYTTTSAEPAHESWRSGAPADFDAIGPSVGSRPSAGRESSSLAPSCVCGYLNIACFGTRE